jgi:indolepyruvate ferredoxin oxidoreductase beta subunit
MQRLRVFLTGVGGQGTLTSTRLLALAAMDSGLEVVSGEIHGMAQRGGVVESTVLVGGFASPKISPGRPTSCSASSPWRPGGRCPCCAKGDLRP